MVKYNSIDKLDTDKMHYAKTIIESISKLATVYSTLSLLIDERATVAKMLSDQELDIMNAVESQGHVFH